MRYMLPDDLWAAMEPLVLAAKTHRGGQPPVLSERMFFEAVLYLGRTGVPLRDLPGEFGEWDAVYNRLRRWVRSGAMKRLFEGLTADPQCGGYSSTPPPSAPTGTRPGRCGRKKDRGGTERRGGRARP